MNALAADDLFPTSDELLPQINWTSRFDDPKVPNQERTLSGSLTFLGQLTESTEKKAQVIKDIKTYGIELWNSQKVPLEEYNGQPVPFIVVPNNPTDISDAKRLASKMKKKGGGRAIILTVGTEKSPSQTTIFHSPSHPRVWGAAAIKLTFAGTLTAILYYTRSIEQGWPWYSTLSVILWQLTLNVVYGVYGESWLNILGLAHHLTDGSITLTIKGKTFTLPAIKNERNAALVETTGKAVLDILNFFWTKSIAKAIIGLDVFSWSETAKTLLGGLNRFFTDGIAGATLAKAKEEGILPSDQAAALGSFKDAIFSIPSFYAATGQAGKNTILAWSIGTCYWLINLHLHGVFKKTFSSFSQRQGLFSRGLTVGATKIIELGTAKIMPIIKRVDKKTVAAVIEVQSRQYITAQIKEPGLKMCAHVFRATTQK